jgi:HEAT repeat protein
MGVKSKRAASGAGLSSAVIDLLEHERVELRAAAATVLSAVGKGDGTVVSALTDRLEDPDPVVRRIALEGLADMGASGIASRLVPLLRGDDATLAERAAQLLAAQGAAAETALRKELGQGTIQARRAMASLLLRRGTSAAIDAVLDQLGDPELGEQALQLLRAEIDHGNEKVIALLEKGAQARAAEVGKRLQKEWARAVKESQKAEKEAGKGKAKGKGQGTNGSNGANGHAADPNRDPAVAAAVFEEGLLLRLIGYMARPSAMPLLIAHAEDDRPRSIRLAAIAAMRRIVASSEAKGTEKAIEVLIELAGGDDLAVAQSAVDTLRGARIPERLAKPFAALAKSKNTAAQKLAMERMPAGGGASAVKALIDALGGNDPTARDAAARGLAKAPEAVLPLARALIAADNADIARRYAGALRAHRGHVSSAALDELAGKAQEHLDLHARGKANADTILLERVLVETLADVAPARHVELLFDHARKLRKASKPIEAFGALKPLLRSHADLDAAIDDDMRFFMAVLGLEALGQGILRATGADAPVIEQFNRLAARGYPVAKKLAREKDVGDEDMYALGFRLLESKDGQDQELGAELMQGIIEERPRSKLAKNARNKLKLAGYLDDE